jgi:hypothetical protein
LSFRKNHGNEIRHSRTVSAASRAERANSEFDGSVGLVSGFIGYTSFAKTVIAHRLQARQRFPRIVIIWRLPFL